MPRDRALRGEGHRPPVERPGIIRNRAKVLASIGNAQAYLKDDEGGKGSFRDFLWKHVDHKTIVNNRTSMGSFLPLRRKAMP